MRKSHAFLVAAMVLSLFSSEAAAGNPFKKALRWAKKNAPAIGIGAAAVGVSALGGNTASAYTTPGPGAGVKVQHENRNIHVYGDRNGGALDYRHGNWGVGGSARLRGGEKRVVITVGGSF